MAVAQKLVAGSAVLAQANSRSAGRQAGGSWVGPQLPARALPRRLAKQTAVRAIAASGESGKAAQMREAEERWQSQIRQGRVKNVDCKTAAQLVKEGWVLLDVRPPFEVEKAAVEGAVNVPIYVPEEGLSVANLMKASAHLGLGGWWLGGTHTKPNPAFMRDVQAQVPRDAKVVVACQKGLRSLAACEQLSLAGYETLAWINGGFDTAKAGDLPTNAKNNDLRYGGIGGVSEALGWTDVQQAYQGSGFAGGSNNLLKLALLVVVADAALFAYEFVMAYINGKV